MLSALIERFAIRCLKASASRYFASACATRASWSPWIFKPVPSAVTSTAPSKIHIHRRGRRAPADIGVSGGGIISRSFVGSGSDPSERFPGDSIERNAEPALAFVRRDRSLLPCFTVGMLFRHTLGVAAKRVL